MSTNNSRDAEDKEVIIDLTDEKYVGFIIPANPTYEVPLCKIMSEEDMIPFRAKPLTKKLNFKEVKKAINCTTGEFVFIKPHLKPFKIREIIIDEEGHCVENPIFNVDATALAIAGFDTILVGDVAFLKYSLD